jgi:hypothetical protein
VLAEDGQVAEDHFPVEVQAGEQGEVFGELNVASHLSGGGGGCTTKRKKRRESGRQRERERERKGERGEV